jgi:hypothetical protein
MATGKSKSIKWLSIHVGVYALVALISLVFLGSYYHNFLFGFYWWITNVILHFVVDFLPLRSPHVFGNKRTCVSFL